MNRLLTVATVVLSLTLGAACGSSETKPDEAPAPTDPAAAPGEITVEGPLKYTELPRTKSVEAYMGVEFSVEVDGKRTVLAASEKVSREQLLALDGKRVKLHCAQQPASTPNPMESAPMGPDGKPLQRPAECKVSWLKAL